MDVFFVLSGYLITTLLLREKVASGRIRMGAFWARRARRLLPAIVLLVIVTGVVTALTAPIAELTARRDDMISTLFYFANWHFIATDASYFASFLDASPLRHMWSLAIEEQFYILWPLILIAVLYLARGRRVVLFAVLGVGIAVSAVMMAATYDPANPSRAYFGTDTHAYPLLIGGALAVAISIWPRLLSGQLPRRLAGWAWPVVVGALALAVLELSDQGAVYYRGGLLVFALCVAAALWIVEALPRSLPARILSLRLVCWIGVISYGLYLWHWPLLVWIGEPAAATVSLTTVRVVAATFVVATLSYYLVERPVRRQRIPWIRGFRGRQALALVAVILTAGMVALWATRISPSEELASQLADTSDIACPDGSPKSGSYSWCLMTPPSGPDAPVIATAGDSTSRALTLGLREVAGIRGWGYVQAGQDGCSILSVVVTRNADDSAEMAGSRRCANEVPGVLEDVLESADPDLWIISDRWLLATLVLPDGTVLRSGDPRRDEAIVAELSATLGRLSERGAGTAVLEMPPLGPPVECADAPIADCDYSAIAGETAHLNELLAEATEQTEGAVFVPLADIVCPQVPCQVARDGTLIRYDGIHFTGTFSRQIAPEIIERIEQAGVLPSAR